ncbi:MAG: permease-like cell division protein FtsX [Cyclobacteriaceae bacterium]|jgi:cell division transport system permease protein|nr:permease-like cell division protein FtsX [Cyclobacteriaceae bacterium]
MPEPVKFKVRKKKLGSYPYVSVVLSITLVLTFIGAFGCLLIYSKELERVVRENVKVQVYLKSQLTDNDRKKLEKALAAKPFVVKGSTLQFISKEEAAKQFIKETGEDFKKLLGENPLRDAYLVNLDPAYHDKAKLAEIKKELEKMPGVFEAFYIENLIDSINQNVTKIGLVLLGMAVLLLITVILLINNTLRLALFSQRFLIRSMQLVGARDWFIQRPFLGRAAFHGLLAGVLASMTLIGLLVLADNQIEDIRQIQNTERLVILFSGLLVSGVVIAVAGTYRAVYKYLQLSLDELY